jgi:hypothetical protein
MATRSFAGPTVLPTLEKFCRLARLPKGHEKSQGMLKSECIQPKVPLSLEDARKIVGESVSRFNDSHLCSAGDFVTPWRKLQGQESRIFAQLEQNLVAAGLEFLPGRQAKG